MWSRRPSTRCAAPSRSTSTRGAGTTITLKLPLTLAIIDGFLTRIGTEHFIFPLSSVEECIELTRGNGALSKNRNLVNVRGSIVPYHPPAGAVRRGGRAARDRADRDRAGQRPQVGFVVDLVIGQHQTVIKSLGKFYKEVDGISGATILGDGTVALILDLQKLILNAETEELVGSLEQ